MHATYACSRGVSAEAKLDYIGPRGRVRGNMLYLTAVPDRVRLDLSSPFGATLSTLTSDGKRLSLLDLRQKRIHLRPRERLQPRALHAGAAAAARVLVDLLRGEAPVLVHAPAGSEHRLGERSLRRSRSRAPAARASVLELEPLAAGFRASLGGAARPRARSRGRAARRPALRVGSTITRRSDRLRRGWYPDGIDRRSRRAGPRASVQLPRRRIHIEVPVEEHDLVIAVKDESRTIRRYRPGRVFAAGAPGGLRARYSACAE